MQTTTLRSLRVFLYNQVSCHDDTDNGQLIYQVAP